MTIGGVTPAFPTVPIVYTAAGADESPATGWVDNVPGSAFGGVKRESNRLKPISGDSWDYLNGFTAGPGWEVFWFDDGVVNSSMYAGLSPIGSASIDGYGLGRTATGYQFIRLDNNTDVVLATVPRPNGPDDGHGLRRVGQLLQIFHMPAAVGQWIPIAQMLDATYIQAGGIAPYLTGAGAGIYNIGAGTFVPEAGRFPNPSFPLAQAA